MAEGFEGFTLFTMSWYRASLLREPSVFLLAEGLPKSRHARISDPASLWQEPTGNAPIWLWSYFVLLASAQSISCSQPFQQRPFRTPSYFGPSAVPSSAPKHTVLWLELWDSKDLLAGNLACDSCPRATCWNSSVPLDPRRSVAMHPHFYDSIILWMKHHILAGVFIYVYCMNHA